MEVWLERFYFLQLYYSHSMNPTNHCKVTSKTVPVTSSPKICCVTRLDISHGSFTLIEINEVNGCPRKTIKSRNIHAISQVTKGAILALKSLRLSRKTANCCHMIQPDSPRRSRIIIHRFHDTMHVYYSTYILHIILIENPAPIR